MLRRSGTVPKKSEHIPLRARFASWIGVAPEGLPISLPAIIVGLALGATSFYVLGAIFLIAGAAVAAFFRDPDRYVVAGADAVVSGADGRVCEIAIARLPGMEGQALYTRVSVFMSPLNVHVNRAPISGAVAALKHAKGEFRAAFRDAASERNERNSIKIRDDSGRDHVLVQVAGYLARRIVCYLRPAQRVERGQRLGLIMFGSRVDHFLPQSYRVTVKVGHRVRAGETIIGEPRQ